MTIKIGPRETAIHLAKLLSALKGILEKELFYHEIAVGHGSFYFTPIWKEHFTGGVAKLHLAYF